MRALVFDRYGAPEVVRVSELADPVASDTAVLVRVHTVCVTSADSAARSGTPAMIRLMTGLLRPRQRVLGTEFAGVVAAIGASVTRFAVGDRVVAASGASFGAHAELVTVDENGAIARVPASLDLGDALAICEGGLTALPFLRDAARLRPGQRVLVNGASGAVGSAGVQLAVLMGADVTAVSSAQNTALTASLGAARTIDYRTEDFTRSAELFDVVFDAVGTSSFGRSRRVLAPGGVYLTTVPTLGIAVASLTARVFGRRARLALTGLRAPDAKRADLEWLLARAEAGELSAVVDARHDFTDAVAAYARVDSGRKVGALLLVLPAAVR